MVHRSPIKYRPGSPEEISDYRSIMNANPGAVKYLFNDLVHEKLACINALEDALVLLSKVQKTMATLIDSRCIRNEREREECVKHCNAISELLGTRKCFVSMRFKGKRRRSRRKSRRKKSKRKSRSKSRSSSPVPANVVNKALYVRARNKVKRRVKKWPSAYASGQVVMEYKRMGGKYRGRKKTFGFRSKSRRKSKRKSRRRKSKNPGGLSRWFAEEWVDVCTGKPCGRKSARGSRRKYPYCRPKRRVTSRTPRTARSLTRAQKKKMCARKRRSPSKRMKSLRRKSRKKSRRRKSR
jgi:hypothetical protein